MATQSNTWNISRKKYLSTFMLIFRIQVTFPFTADRSVFCFSYQAALSTGLNLPYTVHEIMNRWILQMGFPLVTIDTATGSISQQHFLLDPDAVVDRPSIYK